MERSKDIVGNHSVPIRVVSGWLGTVVSQFVCVWLVGSRSIPIHVVSGWLGTVVSQFVLCLVVCCSS